MQPSSADTAKSKEARSRKERRHECQATLSPGNPQARRLFHVAEVTGGKLVYIAGQVALDVQGNLVGKDDFAAQIRQVFSNLKVALEAAGATFHDVIKLNYFCADSVDLATQLPVVRDVRDGLVNTAAPPVSTFVVVSPACPPGMVDRSGSARSRVGQVVAGQNAATGQPPAAT